MKTVALRESLYPVLGEVGLEVGMGPGKQGRVTCFIIDDDNLANLILNIYVYTSMCV